MKGEREKEKKAEKPFWEVETLSRKLTREVLEVIGVSVALFEQRYTALSSRSMNRFRGRAPTEKEIRAVEAFQETGDLLALRQALGCTAGKAYSHVTRVVAHQARTRKGKAA